MRMKVSGFCNYEISDDGCVYNKCGTVIKPFISKQGYYRVSLYNNGRYHKFQLHRLVAEHFIPNPHNLPQVNHKDGNKLNNNVYNLEWCTQSDNIIHAINNNLYTRQSDNQKKAAITSANKHSKKVKQLDTDGNVINVFRNKYDASKVTGAMPNNIKMCCDGKRKSAGGFRWSY
jgi:hypothetical protein